MKDWWSYAVLLAIALAVAGYVFRDTVLGPYSVRRVAEIAIAETDVRGERKNRYGMQAVIAVRNPVPETELVGIAQKIFDERLRSKLDNDFRYVFGMVLFVTGQSKVGEVTRTNLFPVMFERVNGDWQRTVKK
ncbi:MAG: hypothetical protein HOP09_18260 [Hyphomicrobium sp.]|nr:hypothetical protein [Hyphomicrobium sp.]